MTKIISYNVNGIRAAMRKDLIPWLKGVNADIICLQEIKANEDQIDVEELESLGYHCYWNSAEKKGYSGVAILSKKKASHISKGIGNAKFDSEGRLIMAKIDDLNVISVYHPSGSSKPERLSYKFDWMDAFMKYTDSLSKNSLLISGDFNICKEAIDIHNPKANLHSSGFLPEERAWLGKFIDSGFIDSFRLIDNSPNHYTWWSYRTKARERNLGWRIDYHMISRDLENKVKRSIILKEAYHSDHAPILIELLG